MKLYDFPEKYIPADEMIIKMLRCDGARVFTLLLSINDLDLHGQMDLDQEVAVQLGRANNVLERKE